MYLQLKCCAMGVKQQQVLHFQSKAKCRNIVLVHLLGLLFCSSWPYVCLAGKVASSPLRAKSSIAFHRWYDLINS